MGEILVSGFWLLVSGFWFLVTGFWFLVAGIQVMFKFIIITHINDHKSNQMVALAQKKAALARQPFE